MANKQHHLDEPIIKAALQEFLEKGYEKASLRKIAANADVTIGAIYTRYQTKDALFCSLAEPLVLRIREAFSSIRQNYTETEAPKSPEALVHAMQSETEAILHLLFDDYDRAVLLLCRSTGSSLEHFPDLIIERKIEETAAFFRNASVSHPDEKVLKLLVTAQFHMYIQIISEGYRLETARELMNAAAVYHTGGWLAMLGISGGI